MHISYLCPHYVYTLYTDCQIKCSADILRAKHLSETLVKFTIPESEYNTKVFSLTRQNMQCLRQCPDNGSSIGCWLNDEVTAKV